MTTNAALSPADPDRRLYPPERRAPPPGGSRALALAAALALHGGIAALLVLDLRFPVASRTVEEPIPVEIIIPPPPQPPPQPAKPPETKPLDEKEAHDAPREANAEKVERDAPDKTSSAPTPTPPAEPHTTPQPSETAAAKLSPDPVQPAPKAAAQPQKESETGEATPATPDAPHAEPFPDATAESPATTPSFFGAPFPKWDSGPKSFFGPVADLELGALSGQTPIAGGHARATYLSILYGMVMSKLVRPGPGAGAPQTEGAVTFVVDAQGKLLSRQVIRSSGSSELDAAAFAAVAAAAPYPPPPTGSAVSLSFTYNSPR